MYIGWLCLTSHRQRGHLKMAPPFTVPCEGQESSINTPFQSGIEPGPSHGCATYAPLNTCIYI